MSAGKQSITEVTFTGCCSEAQIYSRLNSGSTAHSQLHLLWPCRECAALAILADIWTGSVRQAAPGSEGAAYLQASRDISEVQELLHGLGRAGAPNCIDLCLGRALHVLIACQVVHCVAENGRVVIDPIQERQDLQAGERLVRLHLGRHTGHPCIT